MAMEKPVNHSADSRLFPYRVVPLLVATEDSGSKKLPAEVAD
jgi:hypothetical protein